ncbi:MAG: ABC transporter permease [Prevotella sp.]|nr:ABC transporter permease [Prevotella sp.]
MKQRKKELMYQEYGKYFLDMSKLIFGGVILAGIMNLGVNNVLLLGSGFVVVIIFATIGFSFYNNSK